MIWSANANSTNISRAILYSAAGFTKVRRWDMWFYGSRDKYVHEFCICNMNTK